MAARYKPSFEDRVAEYIDSPAMTQRLRYGKKVAAKIRGNFGMYHVFAGQSLKKIAGGCSCPSEIVPCKHIHALKKTWEVNPESFFDLDDWLKTLAKQSKAELVEAIGKMVVESPELLGLFGVEGFEEEIDVEEMYYDY